MSNPPASSDRLVAEFVDLRLASGLLGFLLPPLLLAFGQELRPSLSEYYATDARDIFVGVLCAISMLLGAYRGYSRVDDLVGDLGALAALLVALCPCTSRSALVRGVHFGAATTLFVVFACFCLCLFVKGNPVVPLTQRKLQRNSLYRVCGGIIVVGLVGCVLLWWSGSTNEAHALFVVEWLMLWAFALAWMVKGKAFLKDQ